MSSLEANETAEPAAPDAPVEEKIEKDTEASEDVTVDLLPEGKFPTALDLFSISVRNAALRGWVKQPSPCCAASSIAGCFNTIRGLDRKAEGAISHADVIAVMDEQLDEERAAKHASAARLLGLREPAALIALERRVGAIQDAKGRPLTLRKKEALKPPELRVAVKEAAAAFAKGEYTDADETEAEMWTALNEIYDAANTAEEAIAADDPSTIGGAGAPPAGRMPLSILHSISAGKAVGAEGEEDEGEEDESAPSCRGMLDAGAPEGAGAISLKADVNKAIISALKVHIGQLKLRSEHPSTAFFGNGDVLKAVRRMSDKLGLNVVGKTFCGKDVRGAGTIPLKRSDSEAAQEAQWRQLVTEFARSDTALLMHMTNHYCMVYGVREWTEAVEGEEGGTRRVRQVLSSKPGQRPSKWFEWDDLRKSMLHWAGYKMMAVRMES